MDPTQSQGSLQEGGRVGDHVTTEAESPSRREIKGVAPMAVKAEEGPRAKERHPEPPEGALPGQQPLPQPHDPDAGLPTSRTVRRSFHVVVSHGVVGIWYSNNRTRISTLTPKTCV